MIGILKMQDVTVITHHLFRSLTFQCHTTCSEYCTWDAEFSSRFSIVFHWSLHKKARCMYTNWDYCFSLQIYKKIIRYLNARQFPGASTKLSEINTPRHNIRPFSGTMETMCGNSGNNSFSSFVGSFCITACLLYRENIVSLSPTKRKIVEFKLKKYKKIHTKTLVYHQFLRCHNL